MNSRLIGFANSLVQVDYAGPGSEALMQFLFGRLPPAEGEPQAVLRLTAEPPDLWQVAEAGQVLCEGALAATAAEALQARVAAVLAAHSRGGLALHAAAVAWRGAGLLLPGAMRSGKSTLTAWLLTRGAQYLTDELVFIPTGTTQLHGFTRPLHLKPGARPALATLIDLEAALSRGLRQPASDLLPPEVFSALDPLAEAPLKQLIFPQFQAESALRLEPLTPAQAGLALVQSLVNARNLPEHGLPEVARLARAVPAYRLGYGGFAQLPAALADLLPAEAG